MNDATDCSVPQAKSRVRYWPWLVPVLALILVLLGAAVFILLQPSSRPEPYRLALAEIQQNPSAIGMLGEPIQESSSLIGNRRKVTIDEAAGTASMEFEVTGSRDRARIVAAAKRTEHGWEVTFLEIRSQTVFTALIVKGGLR